MPHLHPEGNDFVVDVYIVHRDKVLLRVHDKHKIWLAPGGHVEIDEDPNQAAIREAKEETGLEIKLASHIDIPEAEESHKELIPPRYLNIHNIREKHKHISHVYFATAETYELNPTGSDKTDEMKWFTMPELSDPKYALKKSVAYYAKRALEELAVKD